MCKKGCMVDRRTFVGCSDYVNGCKFSISKTIAGKKLTDTQIKHLIEKGKTGLIKGFKSKAKKPFNAFLVLKEKEVKFEFESKK